MLRLCWVGVALLLVFAGALTIAPEAGLEITQHSEDNLPRVLGDRYFVMAIYLLGALVYPDKRVLSVLLMGFAVLGLWDGVLYLGQNALPHFGIGLLCVFGAWAVWPRTGSGGA